MLGKTIAFAYGFFIGLGMLLSGILGFQETCKTSGISTGDSILSFIICAVFVMSGLAILGAVFFGRTGAKR